MMSSAQLRRLIIAATLVTSGLAACADNTRRISRLDSNGLTVVTLDKPIVLARPAQQLAAAAQDYAYLGPVEINRMGERSYLVWVGLGSTIDRKLIDVAPLNADVLVLLIDDHALTLPLVDWNTKLDYPPYETSTPLYATRAAHTSLNQLRMIAQADSVDVVLVSAAGSHRRYKKWQGNWASWSDLVTVE